MKTTRRGVKGHKIGEKRRKVGEWHGLQRLDKKRGLIGEVEFFGEKLFMH